MTEKRRNEDITGLLFKAVRGLPEDEQRAVFEYFFERGITAERPPMARASVAGLTTLFPAQPIGPDRAMVPVRLSEAQHRRLKAWCAEHNFPMAVVIRGLIDRFLDSWDKRES
jgi:hypothetical protein